MYIPEDVSFLVEYFVFLLFFNKAKCIDIMDTHIRKMAQLLDNDQFFEKAG